MQNSKPELLCAATFCASSLLSPPPPQPPTPPPPPFVIPVDIKAELIKLNKGLLFLFLELLTVLVQQPSGYSSALTPVMVTLHNMMHLLNLARHHQVRTVGHKPMAIAERLCQRGG